MMVLLYDLVKRVVEQSSSIVYSENGNAFRRFNRVNSGNTWYIETSNCCNFNDCKIIYTADTNVIVNGIYQNIFHNSNKSSWVQFIGDINIKIDLNNNRDAITDELRVRLGVS